MRERIAQLHKEMHDFFVSSTMSSKFVDSLVRRIDKFPEEKLIGLLDFMEQIYKKEYAEIIRVWTLPHINPTMWKNYKLYNLRDLPEQIELNEAYEAFSTVVREFLHANGRRVHASEEKVASRRAKRMRERSNFIQETEAPNAEAQV